MHVTEVKKSFVNVPAEYTSSRSELCKHLLSKTCNVNYKIQRSYFYLVSVTKFTNFSGNQVSLVLFHVNSINVILKKKKYQ